MSMEGEENGIAYDGLIYKRITVINHVATGNLMRNIRKAEGLSLRQVARMIGVSAPHLSDLELGRRNWTKKRVLDIREALQKTQENNNE